MHTICWFLLWVEVFKEMIGNMHAKNDFTINCGKNYNNYHHQKTLIVVIFLQIIFQFDNFKKNDKRPNITQDGHFVVFFLSGLSFENIHVPIDVSINIGFTLARFHADYL